MFTWLENIDLPSIAAFASAIAAILAWRVASSSRDIAKNALKLQYMDSIKESIDVIESTLLYAQSTTIQPTDIVSVNRTNYSVSTKRADWIFAAQ
jgi:hypothetical protein